MYIRSASSRYEREPLLAPFGFKGGYISELWQIISRLKTDQVSAMGLGLQSVLWSDAEIFASYIQDEGNEKMYAITTYALSALEGNCFQTPWEALGAIKEACVDYGKHITGRPNMRTTFTLNGLVSVDNALWQAYGREKNTEDFLSLVPDEVRPALSYKHEKLGNIPLITYGLSEREIRKLLDDGAFFLKIKIGCDPDKDGDREKMLSWDRQRMTQIHAIASEYTTPYTESGNIAYYLDANGRYDSKERLYQFIEHMEKIGAAKETVILEEPFEETNLTDVSDIPMRLATDESAHGVKDAMERIDLGYKAIALKPIAKTMSESLWILLAASKRNIPCFCADLTVNPLMVEWNKNVAARIAPLPGIKIGVLESNGKQNYVHWDRLKTFHPLADKLFAKEIKGIYTLNEEFYHTSGGIFRIVDAYESEAQI